jgi:hypothetical protein
MQKYTLRDLVQMTMLGEESFYLASEVDARIAELERERDIARRLIANVLNDLPSNKDWLDPMLEKAMRLAAKSVL